MPTSLHRRLDRLAITYCPVTKGLGVNYHWSLVQVEFATDIVFKHPSDLEAIYQPLVRTAIHAVKPEMSPVSLGANCTAAIKHYREVEHRDKIRQEFD